MDVQMAVVCGGRERGRVRTFVLSFISYFHMYRFVDFVRPETETQSIGQRDGRHLQGRENKYHKSPDGCSSKPSGDRRCCAAVPGMAARLAVVAFQGTCSCRLRA